MTHPYLPAIIEVPGAGMQSHPRCGDADRQRAGDRVSDAYAHGFLTKEEAEARVDAINKATLGIHLELLTQDIPMISRRKGVTLKEKDESRVKNWTTWVKARMPWSGVFGIIVSLTGGILPTVITIAATGGNGPAQDIVAAATIPAAFVTLIASIVATASWDMSN